MTMVLGRPGASVSMSGALDDLEWERAQGRAPSQLRAREAEFLEALGIWEVGPEPVLVATLSGRLRPARGRDRAVLDLAGLEDASIALPRVNRPDWDADLLARALNDAPWAKTRKLRFEAIDADVLRFSEEAFFSDEELAARHDAERMAWLAERLRASAGLSGKSAVLLGPWLGVDTRASSTLSEALGIPVGETLSAMGGAAGIRFERARDRLLATLDVVAQPGRVLAVRGEEGGRAIVELEGDAMLDANVVVLAVGGVAGGGILLSKSSLHGLDEDATHREPFFVPSLESPSVLASSGRPLTLTSSPYGPDFEALAYSEVRGRSLLESVGFFTTKDGRARRADGEPLDWLVVGGDAVADRPRTVLSALRTGLVAGERAAAR